MPPHCAWVLMYACMHGININATCMFPWLCICRLPQRDVWNILFFCWLFAVIDGTQTVLTMPEISEMLPDRVDVKKLSKHITSWPSASSRRQMCEPHLVSKLCNKGNLRAVQQHTELSWAVCWRTTHSRRVSFQVSIRNKMKQGDWITVALPTDANCWFWAVPRNPAPPETRTRLNWA